MRDIKQVMWANSYLSADQLETFFNRLMAMRKEGTERLRQLRNELKQNNYHVGDEADQTRREQEYQATADMFLRDKEKLERVEAALLRIMRGEYGYCIETGEEISIGRLQVNPLVELCSDAQFIKEQREKYQHVA